MAVSDEGAHAARLGEGQRLAVVALAGLGVESIRMACDVAEQVEGMRREPGMARSGFHRPPPQISRRVESAEQQIRTPQPMTGLPVSADGAGRRLTFPELLGLSEPGQRRGRLADFREDIGGSGQRTRKVEANVRSPERRDPVLDE